MLLGKIQTNNELNSLFAPRQEPQLDMGQGVPVQMQAGIDQPAQGLFGKLGQTLGRVVNNANVAGEDGTSFVDKLGAFGASMRDDPYYNEYAQRGLTQKRNTAELGRQDQAAKTQRQQMLEMVKDPQYGFSPREQFLIMASADPEKAMTTIYQNRDKVERGVQGGAAYQLDDSGLQNLGGLAISPQQAIDFGIKREDLALDRERLSQQEAYRNEQLALQRQRERRIASQPSGGQSGGVTYNPNQIQWD